MMNQNAHDSSGFNNRNPIQQGMNADMNMNSFNTAPTNMTAFSNQDPIAMDRYNQKLGAPPVQQVQMQQKSQNPPIQQVQMKQQPNNMNMDLLGGPPVGNNNNKPKPNLNEMDLFSSDDNQAKGKQYPEIFDILGGDNNNNMNNMNNMNNRGGMNQQVLGSGMEMHMNNNQQHNMLGGMGNMNMGMNMSGMNNMNMSMGQQQNPYLPNKPEQNNNPISNIQLAQGEQITFTGQDKLDFLAQNQPISVQNETKNHTNSDAFAS